MSRRAMDGPAVSSLCWRSTWQFNVIVISNKILVFVPEDHGDMNIEHKYSDCFSRSNKIWDKNKEFEY